MPLHTLLVVRSHGYNYEVETIPLKVECVDTYRYQPKVRHLLLFPHDSLILTTSIMQLQDCSLSRTTTDALKTVPAHYDGPIQQTIS